MRLFPQAGTCRSGRWAPVLALGVWAACLAGCGGEGSPDPEPGAPRVGTLGAARTPLAMDAQGHLYGVSECNIRKRSPDGVLVTVARLTLTGSCELPDRKFVSIDGLAVDAGGNFYVADELNAVIRKISAAGVPSVLAGAEAVFGTEDGTGTAARFSSPRDLAVGADGTVHVVDDNRTVRRISPEGVVTTLLVDLDPAPGGVPFGSFSGMAADAEGSVYTVDKGSERIVRISRDGRVSVLAGSVPAARPEQARDGPGDQAVFFRIGALAADAQGAVYVADDTMIRRVTPDGRVSTLADSLDETADAARFHRLLALMSDPGRGGLEELGGAVGARAAAPEGRNPPVRKRSPDSGVAAGPAAPAPASAGGGAPVPPSSPDDPVITPDGTVGTFTSVYGPAATQAVPPAAQAALVIGPDGQLYLADEGRSVLRRAWLP